MSLFDDIPEDNNAVDDGDRIGGFQLWPSGLYKCTIDEAYGEMSKNGAKGLTVSFKNDKGNIFKESFWVVGKNGNSTWERDGITHYIPGYNQAHHLCMLTTGKSLKQLADTIEVKIINERNRETKEMGQRKVEMVMGLINKSINIGMLACTVDKNVQNADDEWVPSGETREQNEIDKFFDAETNRTYSEIAAGKEEAAFVNEWVNNWQGKVKNKAKGLPGSGNKPATGGVKPATKSLFN